MKHSFRFHGIEHVPLPRRGGNRELYLCRRESLWIMRPKSVQSGMNIDHELHYFLGEG